MPFQITPSQAADSSLAHGPWQVSKHFWGLSSCNPGSATSCSSVASALHSLIHRSREIVRCVPLKGCCGQTCGPREDSVLDVCHSRQTSCPSSHTHRWEQAGGTGHPHSLYGYFLIISNKPVLRFIVCERALLSSLSWPKCVILLP